MTTWRTGVSPEVLSGLAALLKVQQCGEPVGGRAQQQLQVNLDVTASPVNAVNRHQQHLLQQQLTDAGMIWLDSRPS